MFGYIKVYFKIPFFKYFLARDTSYDKIVLCIVKKVFENGRYWWREI